VQQLLHLLAALVALMALPPGERDEKDLRKTLADANAFIDSDEGKALGTVIDDFKGQVADLKKVSDEQSEEVRRIAKMGLAVSGGQIINPQGLTSRREMIADGRAFLSDESARRFGAWCVDSSLRIAGQEGQIPQFVKDIADTVRKDMEIGVDASGAYMIPDEFIAELIRNVEAEGKVFIRCRRIGLVTVGTTKIPKRTAGLTAYWTAPGAQGTRSTPTFDLISLTPEKLMVLVAAPNEFYRTQLLIDLGNFIGLEIAHAIPLALDDAVVNGDMSASYGGITGILQSANITSVAAASTHTTVATLDGTDISNVIAGLAVGYALDEAEWGMSLSVMGKLRALKTSTGEPLYQRSDQGVPATIDDFPFMWTPRMPASGSIGAAAKYAWFGDLQKSHIVGMIRSIELAKSEHALFESDMTVTRGILHVDCQEQDATAIVTAKTAAA